MWVLQPTEETTPHLIITSKPHYFSAPKIFKYYFIPFTAPINTQAFIFPSIIIIFFFMVKNKILILILFSELIRWTPQKKKIVNQQTEQSFRLFKNSTQPKSKKN